MTKKEDQIKADDDEISLIDVILFLKVSGSNIVKSTLVCLLAGGVYYLVVPKMYEVSANIKMATVASELVESPAALLEIMNIPLYFSPATFQACSSSYGGLSSQGKLADKIKSSFDKSTLTVSFVTQAPSTQEAKACMNAMIAELTSHQDAIAKPLIAQKKQKLQQLKMQLERIEEFQKNLPPLRTGNNLSDEQLSANIFNMTFRKESLAKTDDLQLQIISIENELAEPKTRPFSLFGELYSSEIAMNKRPLYTLGLCLALGVLLGLLVTGVMRTVPEIWRQIRNH